MVARFCVIYLFIYLFIQVFIYVFMKAYAFKHLTNKGCCQGTSLCLLIL